MAIISKYPLKVMEEVAPFPPIQNTDNPYGSEAAMHADQANQLQGYGYLVTDVGAFIYLGTVAGTAADYKAFSKKYSKDIILRSDNTSSTLYFYDNLANDANYAFMRYNASNNFFEFGSNDGVGEVISAKFDRGNENWEFKDNIIIDKPGRGVTMSAPGGNARYEIRTNDGGVLELWTVNAVGNLDTLVWSSANAATKREIKEITSNPYTVIESDKNKYLIINVFGGVTLNIPENTFSSFAEIEGTCQSRVSFDQSTGNLFLQACEGKLDIVKNLGSFNIKVDHLNNTGILSGDLILDYELKQSPDGTLHRIGVADDGTRTSILD